MNQQLEPRNITPHEVVKNAIAACVGINEVIAQENELLSNKEMDQLDNIVKQKRSLAAKMEASLQAVKAHTQQIKNNAEATRELTNLQNELHSYKVGMRKNVMLLDAAHASTNNFLNLVRQAVEVKRPKVNVYGNDGAIQDKQAKQTSLVNKSI